MAGVQDARLAVAVSNAGALGSLPCAMLSPDGIRRELEAIVRATSRPYNVNFFCHTVAAPDAEREAAWRRTLRPYYDELGLDAGSVPSGPGRAPFSHEAADVLAAFKPPVVSFHFGLPEPGLLERVRSWGSKILASATTLDEARWLEARGVDAIVAQGFEAGGHRGIFLSGDVTTQVGTFALVRQLVKAVRVPVIAAGGIADAQGVAAAMALGAAGVQIGTAFLACEESNAPSLHREKLFSPDARHTSLTRAFSGRLARSIHNEFIDAMRGREPSFAPYPVQGWLTSKLRPAALAAGRTDVISLWAGQGAALLKHRRATELLRFLVEDTGRALAAD